MTHTQVYPESIRADQAAVLTVWAEFPEGARYRWQSPDGHIRGSGGRVVFRPHKDFSGRAKVMFMAAKDDRLLCRQTVSLDVHPRDPTVIIQEVIKRAKGFRLVRGQVEGLKRPENYAVAVYLHSDVYYRLRKRHIFPLNENAEFSFRAHVGPKIDRMVVHLIRKGLDPDAPGGCQNPWADKPQAGQCTGFFDYHVPTKSRVPLKLDGERSLAFAVHHFMGTERHPDPQVHNLINRFSKHAIVGASESARLIRSFLTYDQLTLYDQALAILVFSHAGLQEPAKRILDALRFLQLKDDTHKDGSWYFSYDSDGKSIYPHAPDFDFDGTPNGHKMGDVRITGAIAWVAMALNAYRLRFDDTQYDDTWHRVMAYLDRTTVSVSLNGHQARAVRFMQSDRPATPWDERTILSIEHNLDAYSAFRHYAVITQNEHFGEQAERIKLFLESLWRPDQALFYPGYRLLDDGVVANTEEIYKDPHSWSLLAFSHSQPHIKLYAPGLQSICELFFEPAGHTRQSNASFQGYFDSRPTNFDPYAPERGFVWTEGTLSVVAALDVAKRALQRDFSCTAHGLTYSRDDLLRSMVTMQDVYGGLAYASNNRVKGDFTVGSSVSGTAWLYFARHGFNPFNPVFSSRPPAPLAADANNR